MSPANFISQWKLREILKLINVISCQEVEKREGTDCFHVKRISKIVQAQIPSPKFV